MLHAIVPSPSASTNLSGSTIRNPYLESPPPVSPVEKSRYNRPTKANGVRETRLVIGLDFGTTYTGIAFATPSGTTCPLKEITVIKDWGSGMKNHDKVPSVISYAAPYDKYQQWGSSLSPNAQTMVHKKLELGPQPLQGELDLVVQVLEGMKDLHFEDILLANDDDQIPAYACKSPEEIVTDYLARLFSHLDRKVEKFSEAFRKHTITDLVVTIPTNWPYEALNSTYRAVIKAGFNRQNFPRMNDILFATESEAAARYTVRHYKEVEQSEFLHENSYFVLCDAGGGTIDVVSYKVIRTHPTLQLQQIGQPSGAKSGSIFIDKAFKRWLRRKIGDHNYRQLDRDLSMNKAAAYATESPAMRQVMDKFSTHKEKFSAFDTGNMGIELPKPLDKLHIPGVVNSGLINISRAAMESFFDACLDDIVRLIRDHMQQIENVASGKPKNLFLVGGFGSSQYLKYHLEATMRDYNVKFRCPTVSKGTDFRDAEDTSWTAIVQGAVVCGIENDQIPTVRRAKSCSCSYGVSTTALFTETNHGREDLALEQDKQWYSQARMVWLLDEGDVYLAKETRQVLKDFDLSFSRHQNNVEIPIYRHARRHDEVEADRPDRLGNAKDDVLLASTLKINVLKFRKELSDRFRGSNQAVQNWQARGQYSGTSQEMMEGVFYSSRTSNYRVTIKLKIELSWESLQVSVLWKGDLLDRVTIT